MGEILLHTRTQTHTCTHAGSHFVFRGVSSIKYIPGVATNSGKTSHRPDGPVAQDGAFISRFVDAEATCSTGT